jgi:TP901 family phage tail tape measure protein
MARVAQLALEIDAKGAVTGAVQFDQATGKIIRGSKRAQGELDKLSKRSKKTGAALRTLARAVTALGVSFSAFLAARRALRVLVEYEQGLIGVSKTTGIAGQELQGLGQDIVKLSTRLPASTKELLELGQAAGQLGVKGADNILKFTETVARLGSASDLAGADAAKVLARMLNVTNESVGEVDRLASVIVKLGNNVAASESEIAGMGIEIASATALYDIGSTRAAAYGARLAELGQRAEASGTAMGRLTQALDAAVRGGGEDLTEIARITGMTGDAFKQAFQQDAGDAMFTYLKGLDNVIRTGGDANESLDKLGLSSVRVSKIIKVLAKDTDLLGNRLELAAEEAEVMTALMKESEMFGKSLASQWKRLQNTLDALVASNGEFVGQMANFVGDLADGIRLWAGLNKEGEQFSKNAKEMAERIDVIARTLSVMGSAIMFAVNSFQALGARLVQFLEWVAKKIGDILGWVFDFFDEDLAKEARKAARGFGAYADAAAEVAEEKWEAALKNLEDMGRTIGGKAGKATGKAIADGITNGLSQALIADKNLNERNLLGTFDEMNEKIRQGSLKLESPRSLADFRKPEVQALITEIDALKRERDRLLTAPLEDLAKEEQQYRDTLEAIPGAMEKLDTKATGLTGKLNAVNGEMQRLYEQSGGAVARSGRVAMMQGMIEQVDTLKGRLAELKRLMAEAERSESPFAGFDVGQRRAQEIRDELMKLKADMQAIYDQRGSPAALEPLKKRSQELEAELGKLNEAVADLGNVSPSDRALLELEDKARGLRAEWSNFRDDMEDFGVDPDLSTLVDLTTRGREAMAQLSDVRQAIIDLGKRAPSTRVFSALQGEARELETQIARLEWALDLAPPEYRDLLKPLKEEAEGARTQLVEVKRALVDVAVARPTTRGSVGVLEEELGRLQAQYENAKRAMDRLFEFGGAAAGSDPRMEALKKSSEETVAAIEAVRAALSIARTAEPEGLPMPEMPQGVREAAEKMKQLRAELRETNTELAAAKKALDAVIMREGGDAAAHKDFKRLHDQIRRLTYEAEVLNEEMARTRGPESEGMQAYRKEAEQLEAQIAALIKRHAELASGSDAGVYGMLAKQAAELKKQLKAVAGEKGALKETQEQALLLILKLDEIQRSAKMAADAAKGGGADEVGKAEDNARRAGDAFDDAGDAVGDFAGRMATDVRDANDALRETVNLLEDIQRVILRETVTAPIGGLVGGLARDFLAPGTDPGFPVTSNPIGFPTVDPLATQALGGAWDKGRMVAFAGGDIVGSPSLFPIAGGRTGLMGEAGPEAIMPLKRGPGGKLGVEAVGGGGGTQVNIGGVNVDATGGVDERSLPFMISEQVRQALENDPDMRRAVASAVRRSL